MNTTGAREGINNNIDSGILFSPYEKKTEIHVLTFLESQKATILFAKKRTRTEWMVVSCHHHKTSILSTTYDEAHTNRREDCKITTTQIAARSNTRSIAHLALSRKYRLHALDMQKSTKYKKKCSALTF